MEIISYSFVIAGLFFMGLTALGLLRLPDFFTRAHAASKSETLGISLILIGLMFESGASLTTFKIALVIIFVFLANPVSSHLLTRSAIKNGIVPWYKNEQNPQKDPSK